MSLRKSSKGHQTARLRRRSRNKLSRRIKNQLLRKESKNELSKRSMNSLAELPKHFIGSRRAGIVITRPNIREPSIKMRMKHEGMRAVAETLVI